MTLSQFQGKGATEGDTRDLVASINALLEKPVPPAIWERTFGLLWPELFTRIAGAVALPSEGPVPPKRDERDVLAELVQSVRLLSDRVERALPHQNEIPLPPETAVQSR